jgi:transposase-like protein
MVSKIKLSEVLSQVFNDLRGRFLEIFHRALEMHLEEIRDEIIRTPRYFRGNVKKRWGYTVRKWMQTPVGILTEVRIPRIRNYAHEISLFCDRYVKRAEEINAFIIEMFLWGMSSRRLSIVSKKLYQVGLTASSVSGLKRLVNDRVTKMRQSPIPAGIKILVIDGLFGKYRKGGRGVCLLAIGIDENGKASILDWLGCDSENGRNWRRLFRQLKHRGLAEVELVVSDDARGVVGAIEDVWGENCAHQLCLWHVSQDLVRTLSNRERGYVKHFLGEYWQVFEGSDLRESQERWQHFIGKWWGKEQAAIGKLLEKKSKLFVYFAYPQSWRYRLRTVNLAEGFFSHLRTFLRRYPGWIDEEHIALIFGLYILGMKVFRKNKENYYGQEIPENILNLNFNRIP